MKNIIAITSLLLVLLVGCEVDDPTIGDISAPENLTLNVQVADDQSGNVTVTPSSSGAINYHVFFEEGQDPVVISEGESASFRYIQDGQYQEIITVIAYGRGGSNSSKSVEIDLDVIFVIDPVILQQIAGDGSKNWIWDSTNAGHFGVGDPAEVFPNFFSAAPGQLNPCMYDDVLTFSYNANNEYTYNLETTDASFINWAEVKRFFPDATPAEFADECRDIDNQIATTTNFVIIPDGDTLKLTVTNSMLSYWSGAMEYEIIELTENILTVRGIQDPFDPPGQPLAWYHTFVPENGGSGGGGSTECEVTVTGDTGSGNNDVLIWSDEFDTDGAPCDGNWSYDLANGNAGWGNGEQQYYTDRPENVIVEDGLLKITARAEQFSGSDYTSARIKTQNKFEFQYGKVEMRAKLPTGAGTWAAFWMLGANIEEASWPDCGEIDIMEHVGNQQDRIFSTLHFPGNSGGDSIGSSTIIPDVSNEFHVYTAEWSADEIRFSVDGDVFYVFGNGPAIPFNQDFFIILNIAMGGNFGGEIDPNFVESTMEVDYVRVYQ